MGEKRFNGKAIYNPSGKAGEYSQWACNYFTGCSNECEYCYCRKGVLGSVWSAKPQLKKCFQSMEHALDVFCNEVDKNEEYIVKDLTPLDNNSVVLESTSTGNVIEFVAEYCKIVKEVSDEPTN